MDAWIWALGLNLGLAALAYLAGTVSRSGVIGGVVVGSAIYLCVGLPGWLMLVGFFVLGSGASKLGYQRKAALGVAQEDRGRRGAKHALANCGTALACAIAFHFWPHPAWLCAYVGAFATALSDTSASEIGQLYGRTPILITTFQRVPVGTEGAVSLEGTLAGIAASLLLALLGWAVGLAGSGVGAHFVWVIAVAAFVGNTLESYLGATLEGLKGIDNEVINFANTVIGAGTAAALCLLVL
jgi:uncharacterized protein (TIGR00297 family)